MSFSGDLYPTAGATSVMTTKGDMVDFDTARQRLGIGSANQILQVKSALPSWETVPLADTVLTTAGDILYENATPELARLASGTQYNTLQMGATLPAWSASATSVMSTTGDLLYASGANTLARLAGGTSGDVLTANGAGVAPSYQTPAGGASFNAGLIMSWAGTNGAIPTDWLLCDGASVATATYPDLFTAIGYVYGGAGANFNLPDLVDKFLRGQSTQTATTGGANSRTLSTSNMPSHTHTVNDSGHSHEQMKQQGGGSYVGASGIASCGGVFTGTLMYTTTETTGITNANTGSGSGFDNQPAFLELQYIIRSAN